MTYLSTQLLNNTFSFVTSTKTEQSPKTSDESVVESSTSQQQNDDVVTLSVKGLETYKKIEDVKISHPQEPLDVPLVDKPLRFENLADYEKKHSKHLSLSAWMLGIDTQGMDTNEVDSLMFLNQKTIDKSHIISQEAMEKIDKRIGEILKSNNIVLPAGEALELSVDRSGKITVDNKEIGEARRTEIENAFNNDKTFGKELLTAHALRQVSESLRVVPLSLSSICETSSIVVDTILQREYGLTLEDFEYVPGGYGSTFDGDGVHTVRSKNGDDDLVKQLFDEEYVLYEHINDALKYRAGIETFGCVADPDFKFSFSYKNDVTVEKGKTDREGLDTMADKFIFSPEFMKYGFNDADYSVTVDSSGFVTDANLIDLCHGKSEPRLLHQSQQEFKMNAFKRYPSELNNSYISETALRQYAIDAQRLARFDGASDEEIRTMKITFGKSNGENKTYFTLKNVV